jgi:hypothetical protein
MDAPETFFDGRARAGARECPAAPRRVALVDVTHSTKEPQPWKTPETHQATLPPALFYVRPAAPAPPLPRPAAARRRCHPRSTRAPW